MVITTVREVTSRDLEPNIAVIPAKLVQAKAGSGNSAPAQGDVDPRLRGGDNDGQV